MLNGFGNHPRNNRVVAEVENLGSLYKLQADSKHQMKSVLLKLLLIFFLKNPKLEDLSLTLSDFFSRVGKIAAYKLHHEIKEENSRYILTIRRVNSANVDSFLRFS